jgi:serine/threonine protein kinase
MPLTAGTRLGAYEVQSAIGVGGMGEVYRATDAVRFARFQREAEVLASLRRWPIGSPTRRSLHPRRSPSLDKLPMLAVAVTAARR